MQTLFEYSFWSEKCGSAANELMIAVADTMGYGVWHFDTRRHYRIWFSKNPNAFMDIENQLRLVHLTANNPSMALVLIYSSKCLNDNAMNELSEFCASNRIMPVDIHSDFKGMCEHPNDRALYELALNEIEYTLSAKGGSFAAASDCIRLMVPVIALFGMYTDFERQLNIETYPAINKCLTPIIIDRRCNDIIAIAINPNDRTKLDSDAVTMIRNAQNQLLLNYKQYGQTIITSERFECEKNTVYARAIKKYIALHPNSTLYELRQFIHEINFIQFTNLLDNTDYKRFIGTSRKAISNEEQLKRDYAEKHNRKKYNQDIATDDLIVFADKQMQVEQSNMLAMSVAPISGPEVMDSLFSGAFEKFQKLSHRQNNIGKMFVDENKDCEASSLKGHKDCDGSWAPYGEQLKQSRSDKIKSNIVFFQRVIRDYNVRNNVTLTSTNFLGQ